MEVARDFMAREMGFSHFRDGQEDILGSVLSGSDTLVIMPTGGGKSLCYQVPAFVRPGMTLVISPLIALMKDQVDTLRVLDLPVDAVHSLMGPKEQEETLRQVTGGNTKLLYASPERLRNPRFVQALKACEVSMVAVDEAHCISQWGHDFRPDYLKIHEALQALGRPQTIALTATATPRVRSDIIEHLKLRAPRVFVTGFDRRNLYWEVQPVNDDQEKVSLIKRRISGLAGGAIIYSGTRKRVERIVEDLQREGLGAEAYHAGMDKTDRTRIQESFMEGRTDYVVATNAFGMGIDRSDIRLVIHDTFPGSIEAYYQESGRAGRDGDPSSCLLLYSPADRRLQEFFIETRYPPKEMLFAVYECLRNRPENLLWLTYREIGAMSQEKIPELAVASAVKILEEVGAVARLHRHENQAELYLHRSMNDLMAGLPPGAKVKRQLLLSLRRLYGDEELEEGIRFLPDELALKTGLSIDSLRRVLSDLVDRNEADYIPPFRGRGLRILRRVSPEELGIDFEGLQVRKAHDLEKLDLVMDYATSPRCRRRFLLSHFGETTPGESCGACDVCENRERGSAPEEEGLDPVFAVKVLSGVARLKGRFGLGMAAKCLCGSRDSMLLQFGLHRLSTYGLLSDFSQSQVQEWIKELISRGCIAPRRMTKGDKFYQVLELTSRGMDVMHGKEVLRLAAPPEKNIAGEQRPFQESEMETFNRLRELRSELARRENLPPYCIFHDRTLKEMARTLPVTALELREIVGVGDVTLKKYGRAFLALLNQIRHEKH
jgi:ATP-dependent DNA helicase RecQ